MIAFLRKDAMLLFDQIKNESNFSNSEQVIAEYIIAHPNKVLKMTIHELAQHAYSSSASVTRFCKRLNLNGFSDLKVKLARDMSSFNIQKERVDTQVPFNKGEEPLSIMNAILNLNYQTMQDTYNHLNQLQMERVAKSVFTAKHVHLFGSGQSLIQAMDFQYKLIKIGIDANVENNHGFQLMKAHSIDEDSVAVIISFFGKDDHNLNLVKVLKDKGIFVVLITGPQRNPLVEYADEVIHVPPQEKVAGKMASYSSRTAIQLVLDLLYALIFSYNYDEFTEMMY